MIRERDRSSNAIHDAIAATYGYDVDANVASRLKVELLHRNVHAGTRVLDVGCANGLHLRLVAPLCAEAVGIDVNERMVDLARERLAADGIDNARVELASATQLPFADGTFQTAYSFSTLLLIEDLDGALSEIARVLSPGGVAVLDVTGRWNLSQRHWRRWYRKQGHFGLHALSFPQARGLLSHHGFEIAESHALGFTDQWKYLPLVGRLATRMGALDRALHGPHERDLDYRVSNFGPLFGLANRWYLACRKVG
jgi:ubiquinone/menaquinone biosynthesis C-methylase UbiE